VLNFADHISNDKPLEFHGPATLDRTHMLSVASLFTIPGGVRINSIWRAFSALPQTLFVPQVSGGAAEIFQTDFDGMALALTLCPAPTAADTAAASAAAPGPLTA